MYTKSVVLLAVVALSTALPVVDEEQAFRDQFSIFKSMFDKVYEEKEEEVRAAIFKQNLQFIAEHNAKYEAGEVFFEVGVNQFADMSSEEYQRWVGPSVVRPQFNGTSTYMSPQGVTLPAEVDWRTHKPAVVTPVKDQKQCGSCWSFSTTGSVEGQTALKAKAAVVSLSEQNLVDCATGKYGNQGCRGGWPARAMAYIKDNGGIDTEKSYPYEAKDDKCRYNAANSAATVTGSVELPQGKEAKLQEAVATVGPVSICIDASHLSFQLYKHGVYSEARCSSTHLDHAVLAVGYGSDGAANGGDYWLVKNSWNTHWGMDGYIKIARNANNMCGVAEAGAYPLV